jgi:hypothetical protein
MNEQLTYLRNLVLRTRRKDSLIMRVDLHTPHDTTYVFGRKLTPYRVRTL